MNGKTQGAWLSFPDSVYTEKKKRKVISPVILFVDVQRQKGLPSGMEFDRKQSSKTNCMNIGPQ